MRVKEGTAGTGILGKIMALAAVMLISLAILGCGGEDTAQSGTVAGTEAVVQSSREKEHSMPTAGKPKYTRKDMEKLRHTEHFARGALEHIFDGTINKKGKATGYHYSMMEGSKGQIIDGTRSETDANGVFTAKVQVKDVKKNGFSSFYPETWSPQEVVDAINEAYRDAVNNPKNPRDELWIGHYEGMEIDMYLNEKKKILTAYPIFVGGKR